MKNLCAIVLVLMSVHGLAQKGSYYGNPADAADFCAIQMEMTNSFATNNEAQLALNKIINVLGVSQRFAIYQCNGIDNCQAVTIRGIRYIFYDSYFMKEISNNANTSWTNFSILAHEVGHHINGHTVDLIAAMTGQIETKSLAEKRQQELEADEFSGYVLYKLGATLLQAQQAMNTSGFNGDDSYSTHPNKSKRLAAIEKGFNKAKISTEPIIISNNESNIVAETYFYQALNNQISSTPNDTYIIENYTKAIQNNPNFVGAYNNRGIQRNRQELYNIAIVDFNKAIQLDPQNVDAYVNKGFSYFKLNEKLKALELYNQAISINPNYAVSYNNRGALKAGMGDKSAAIADLDMAISIRPDYAQAYLTRGLCKGSLKNYQGGISDLDIVISLQPEDAFSYNMRGLLKKMMGAKNYCEDFVSACSFGKCDNFYKHCR
jgi:tetratricopeptide (TPR) repeat protein